jgi:hypothetical protein
MTINIHQDCVVCGHNHNETFAQTKADVNAAGEVIEYMALDPKDFANETIIGLYYFDNMNGYDAIVVSQHSDDDGYMIRMAIVIDANDERTDKSKGCFYYSDAMKYLSDIVSEFFYEDEVSLWLKAMKEKTDW